MTATRAPTTPAATLRRARQIALETGLHYVYTGNVRDEEGQSTWCHGCGRRVIGRDGYTLTEWSLGENGACRFCGTVCAGVFESTPGDWGARRLPVRLAEVGATA